MDGSSKEKATRETRVDFGSYSSSRCLFLDAFKAVLNCLGVEWEIKECYLPLELKDDNKSQGATCSQEPAQTTTAATFTSGTAPEADPPTNIIPSEDPAPTSISVTSVPKQPRVSGGGGPKIN